MKSHIFSFLTLLLLSATLSACSGITFHFSPEAAVTDVILQQRGIGDMTVNPQSIVIRQTHKIDSSSAIVVYTFQALLNDNAKMDCLYSTQTRLSIVGWQVGSGGGGCSSAPKTEEGQEPLPIQFGSGISTSDQGGNTSLSDVYGLVTNPEIVKVRVTWEDDQTTEAEVINSSFITFRNAAVGLKTLDGLNQKGESIFNQSPATTPEKK